MKTVVIGAGANELVAAHYLARAGHEVIVLEEHDAPRDEVMLDSGWISPRIVRDLGLHTGAGASPALALYRPDPWATAVLGDGGRLELWNDPGRSVASIRRLSARDAARWPQFCAQMSALARILESLYVAPPPDLLARDVGELARLAGIAFGMRRLGRQNMEALMRLLPMAVSDLLDDWFESDVLKGVLAGTGIMHLCQGPRSGGTAFRLLHHHVGNATGVFRPLRSNLRRVLEARPGIALRRAAPAARITVRQGHVAGVVLASGEEIAARLVVCGADPRRTLLDRVEAGALAPEFTRAVRHIRSRGVVARVNLVLERAPQFGTLVLAPSLDYLERAYDDAKYGRISERPYMEARAAGSDGANAHYVEVDVQYAPYALADGTWDETRRHTLAQRAVEMLGAAMPGFAEAVTAAEVLTPRDLEARYGFPEGQPHHAELALDQSFWMRPLPGWASYRSPIAGLYFCGPGTHPGGAIGGAAGANAARIVLKDLHRSGKG